MYQFSEKSLQLQSKLQAFMDENIYPNEKAYAEQLHAATDRFAALPRPQACGICLCPRATANTATTAA